MMKKILLMLTLLVSAITLQAQHKGDHLINCKWHNVSGSNRIQFVKESNGTYTGRVIWLAEPNDKEGKPRLDVKNPDKARRSNKLLGTTIVWGLTFDNGQWSDGTLYSPTKGLEVKGSVKINAKGELELKGTKFGISQTEVFKQEKL